MISVHPPTQPHKEKNFQFLQKLFLSFSQENISTSIKKINLEGIFEFFYSDPQLDQNFKPTRNFSGHFLYIHICIYEYSV